MPLISDRVQETTTTSGTGTISLAGAVTGYRPFSAAFSNGDLVFYTIDDTVGNWEVGVGTVGSGTLARTTILLSSNSNNVVNFGVGSKRVFCTAPSRALLPDQTGNSAKVLSTDGTNPSWITPNAGTVTGVSVATDNGFSGSATSGATPEITLGTTISGVVKGTGSALAAATAGTDYLAPAAIGTTVQAWDTDLDWVAANLTTAGKALIDDADAAAQRTTLGLGTMATQAASNVAITGGSATLTGFTVGTAALTTNATTGFPWVPSCPGTPTGAPTAPYSNASALVTDTTNNRFCVRIGSAWRQIDTNPTNAPAVYNVVSQYGADPTGATAATTAVQNAIDAAAANPLGGVVVFPAGDYLVGTLTIYPNVSIQGAGRRTTTLIAAANSTTVFNCTTSGVGIEIRDLTINNGTTPRSSVTGIKIYGPNSLSRVSNIYIENIELIGDNTTEMLKGIDLYYCVNVKISGVWMSNATTGVSCNMCADVDILNTTVQLGAGIGYSITGDGSSASHEDEGIRIVGCSTNGQNQGLVANDCSWGTVSGCSFTTALAGAVVASHCTQWKFTGSEFAGASGGAVVLLTKNASNEECDDMLVSGCNISSGAYGLLMSGSGHAVTGCTFFANSNQDVWIGYLTAATYCNVVGNVMRSSNASSGVLEQNSSNYNIITNNNIKYTAPGTGLTIVGANTLYQIGTTPLNILHT